MTLADGLKVNVEPGRAGLSPEQVRALVRGITELYREVRANQEPGRHGKHRDPRPNVQGEQR